MIPYSMYCPYCAVCCCMSSPYRTAHLQYIACRGSVPPPCRCPILSSHLPPFARPPEKTRDLSPRIEFKCWLTKSDNFYHVHAMHCAVSKRRNGSRSIACCAVIVIVGLALVALRPRPPTGASNSSRSVVVFSRARTALGFADPLCSGLSRAALLHLSFFYRPRGGDDRGDGSISQGRTYSTGQWLWW
jgi:hypothetical protein